MSFKERRRKKLQERLDILLAQYDSAFDQLNSAIDAANAPVLKKRIQTLETEIHEIEEELKDLNNVVGVSNPGLVPTTGAQHATPLPDNTTLPLPDVSKILPPPFEWCVIPAGWVTLEYDEYALEQNEIIKEPTRAFYVDEFAIAKYPITNGQFQQFVSTPDGWRDPKWWDFADHAREWRSEKSSPEQTGFAGNDLPRTNVSWYEAMAFGRWLTSRLEAERAGTQAPPLPITLPTEQQWQRAAQGDDGLAYPYGNTFDKSHSNTKEGGIGQPTPVTQYPNGASPFGVMDMSGNVWEWTVSLYKDSLEVLGTNRSRVLRGGFFYIDHRNSQSTFRKPEFAFVRSDGFGFRVALCKVGGTP